MSDLHNVEAEQVILGALLLNNEMLDRVPFLDERHFYDAVHGRVFAGIRAMVRDGRVGSPVTLKFLMGDDKGLAELGGAPYLARLASVAVVPSAMVDTCRTVQELWARREMTRALADGAEMIAEPTASVGSVAAEVERRIGETLLTGGAKPSTRSFVSVLGSALTGINSAFMNDAPPGVSTGYRSLDAVLGSLRPGRVYLLAGRPSMGKTAVAINIMARVAGAGQRVLMSSLEMPEEDLVTRIISQMMREQGKRVPYSEIDRGNVEEGAMRDILALAKAAKDMPIRFIDREHAELTRMTLAIQAEAKRSPLGLVVIDYLQLIDVMGARNSFERVGLVSKSIKRLAMQLGIPILLLSQLNRELESRDDKRPRISDLRQSGEIEEDADTIMMVYRGQYYLERSTLPPNATEAMRIARYEEIAASHNRVEIIFGKNRGGPVRTATLRCEIEHNFLCEPADYDDLKSQSEMFAEVGSIRRRA